MKEAPCADRRAAGRDERGPVRGSTGGQGVMKEAPCADRRAAGRDERGPVRGSTGGQGVMNDAPTPTTTIFLKDGDPCCSIVACCEAAVRNRRQPVMFLCNWIVMLKNEEVKKGIARQTFAPAGVMTRYCKGAKRCLKGY